MVIVIVVMMRGIQRVLEHRDVNKLARLTVIRIRE